MEHSLATAWNMSTALPVTAQARYNEAIELQEKGLDAMNKNDDDFTRRHIPRLHNTARTYESRGLPQKALELHFH